MNEFIKTVSGKIIKKEEVDVLVEKVHELILNELPEETRTYDMALFVIKEVKRRMKGAKISL